MAARQRSLIHADALSICATADMIFTDPPFEMEGSKLWEIISNYDANHIILITTMRQLLGFFELAKIKYKIGFDFVIAASAPKNDIANLIYT